MSELNIKKTSDVEIEKLKKITASKKELYLKTLEDLVKIDSVTGNKEGSKKIFKYIKSRLEPLGAKTETHESEAGIHAVFRFQGKGTKKTLIYDHTDTVTNDAVTHFEYDKERDIVTGQGAADSKGSVAFLIILMEIMHELNIKPYKEIILYFDCEEEVGSEFEDELIGRLSDEADLAFVADTGRPDLGIVTRRKATGDYRITIEGISGHAGNGPHATANALTEAGFIITKLYDMQSALPEDPLAHSPDALKERGIVDRGQFIPENVINVSVVSTPNTKTNIVPDRAVIQCNLRTYRQSEYERLERELFGLADHTHRRGIKVKVDGHQGYKPLEATGNSKKLADIYKLVGKNALNRDIPEFVAGGVTPSNIIINKIPVIDSVGVDSDPTFEHSSVEELDTAAFEPRTILAIEFFKAIEQVEL